MAPLDLSLEPLTDVYFRGYDQNYPDLWRYNEWKREFDQYCRQRQPAEPVAGPHQPRPYGQFRHGPRRRRHAGNQQADCDLALGPMVQDVAKSRYAADTLFFIIEDDVQDGPDHVDSHRGTAFVAGPYVKQGAVVKTRYGQVNVLRTIEDIFGTEHINLNTAFQRPMTEVFDVRSSGEWSYVAEASTVLASTTVASLDNTVA